MTGAAEEAQASVSDNPNPLFFWAPADIALGCTSMLFSFGGSLRSISIVGSGFATDWCSLLLFMFLLVLVLCSHITPSSCPPSPFHVVAPCFIPSTCSTPRLLEHQLQTQKRSYDVEVEALRGELQSVKEENNRQQQLLAQNLQLPPEARIEASLQHEITRLTNENLVRRCAHRHTTHRPQPADRKSSLHTAGTPHICPHPDSELRLVSVELQTAAGCIENQADLHVSAHFNLCADVIRTILCGFQV